jgi:hypothetical protein
LGNDCVAVPEGTTATAPGTARKEDEQAPTSTQNVTTGGVNTGAGSHEAPPVGKTAPARKEDEQAPADDEVNREPGTSSQNADSSSDGFPQSAVQVLLDFCQPGGLNQPQALKELVQILGPGTNSVAAKLLFVMTYDQSSLDLAITEAMVDLGELKEMRLGKREFSHV